MVCCDAYISRSIISLQRSIDMSPVRMLKKTNLKKFTHHLFLQAFLGGLYLCSADAVEYAGYMEDIDLVTDEPVTHVQTVPYVMRHRMTVAEKNQIFQEVAQNLQAYNLELDQTQVVNRNKLNLRGRLTLFSETVQGEILAEICRFSWLTELNCSYNSLSSIPEQIGQLSGLKYFNCSHNHLVNLPEQMTQLTALRNLDCSHNYLVNLPENIGQLSNLTAFNCSYNLLNFMPLSVRNFANFTALGAFNLQGNTLYPYGIHNSYGVHENLGHAELMGYFNHYISLDNPPQNFTVPLVADNMEGVGDIDLILGLVANHHDYFFGNQPDFLWGHFSVDQEMEDVEHFSVDQEMEDVFEVT